MPHGEKVIIFDWDDTFFPTFLSLADPLAIDYVSLNRLDKLIVEILSLLLKRYHLFIVTNSQRGWVEKSSSIYLPTTHRFIEQHNNSENKFCVVSARFLFEKFFPKDPVTWKVYTFRKIIEELQKQYPVTEIISYGDGLPERVATHQVTSESIVPRSASHATSYAASYAILGKSFQFLQQPKTITDLLGQLTLVAVTLPEVLSLDCDVDAKVVKNKKDFYFTENV